jgi:hypothetical protein
LLAALATAYSKTDPEYAVNLLVSGRKVADELPDNTPRLRALASIANAALDLHDLAQANATIVDALDLGEEIVNEDLDVHPGQTVYMSEGLDTVSSLVELAVQVAGTTRLPGQAGHAHRS